MTSSRASHALTRLFVILPLVALLTFFSSASASAATASAAWHRGTLEGDGITWRSTYVLADGRERGDILRFAAPLADTSALEPTPDATAVYADGHVVGLRMEAAGVDGAHVVVAVVRERGAVAVGAVSLHPPLADGGAVQIVELVGDSDQRFEPDPRSGLSRHMGFFAPDIQPMAARMQAERLVGYGGRGPVDQPMYVDATTLRGDPGVVAGTLSNTDSRMHAGVLGAAVVFFAIVAALAFGHRALARAAKLEHAEAVLNEEFTKLDGEKAATPPRP